MICWTWTWIKNKLTSDRNTHHLPKGRSANFFLFRGFRLTQTSPWSRLGKVLYWVNEATSVRQQTLNSRPLRVDGDSILVTIDCWMKNNRIVAVTNACYDVVWRFRAFCEQYDTIRSQSESIWWKRVSGSLTMMMCCSWESNSHHTNNSTTFESYFQRRWNSKLFSQYPTRWLDFPFLHFWLPLWPLRPVDSLPLFLSLALQLLLELPSTLPISRTVWPSNWMVNHGRYGGIGIYELILMEKAIL